MRLKYFFKFIEKKLRIGFVSNSGRNFLGVICVHHRGGGSKKKSYFVDFFRRLNSFGYIIKILKVPFYSSFLGLIVYQNGLSCYTLLSEQITIGSRIFSGFLLKDKNHNQVLTPGSSVLLSNINLFSNVSNIEIVPYYGGILSRAAGTGFIITSKLQDKVLLKSKSGWQYLLSKKVMCTIGFSSNLLHRFTKLKKAGYNRSLGLRPIVRGVAMNPCDHPHGGGEGRKSPLASPKSPWGWLTKGTPSKNKLYHKIFKKEAKVIR